MKLRAKYPLVVLFVVFASAWVIQLMGLMINVTPSMPKGIYIKENAAIQKGSIVAACLAPEFESIGLERRYLGKGGRCQGIDPVIKKVIAVPGDTVDLQNQFIQVNGIRYDYPTYQKDSQNRPMLIYPRGVYQPTTGYWLIGTQDSRSWDSRYWGPVKSSQILMVLKPVLTF